MNRIDRLTGTILLLQNHRGVSAEAIAEHWEISVRTVYRDLAALGEAGVPVYYCEERQGYLLMSGYHLPPIQFTDGEAAALAVSGVVTRGMGDESLAASLRSALVKIESVLPEASRDYLDGLEDSVGVWTAPGADGERGHRFMPVQDAVLRRRCIHLRYDTAGRGQLRERIVEPLGLLFYGDHWHLIAYCRWRRDFRDFRLDRVRSMMVLDETFEGHRDFRLDDFLDEVIRDCELMPVTVTLSRFQRDRFLRELFGSPTREEPLPDDRFRLSVLASTGRWLADWLLGFGRDLVVESPDSLRRQLAEAAGEIAVRYRDIH